MDDLPQDDRPSPTAGHDDELLDELPAHTSVGGTLEGYARGRRSRLILLFVAIAVFAGLALAVWTLQRPARIEPHYNLVDPELPSTDRVLQWETEGEFRLGLTRKPPGVLRIDLPDRSIRLAEESDHAQVMVRIERGETRAVRTITGRVVVDPRP